MIAAGEPLGHYRIGSKLGEGGMGVVYRAHDTRLGRDVAIKVLPESVSHDPERLARFEREARTLAALNHPNIAAVYGVEQGALVMELVEGETLKGPLPLATAINYARQIARALAAAHEKSIIHRDLKPANIKITPEGKVKLLDFGLAKAMEAPRDSDPENTPTQTALSESGLIMGTAAYMSPEQARAARLDHRTDIWAFGVVLYEMTTGKRLFSGATTSDTLAAVLTKDLPLADAPPQIRRLMSRCLERDVHKRLGWIGEAGWYLDAQPDRETALPRWVIPAIVLPALITAAIVWTLRAPRPSAARPLAVFSFTPESLATTDYVRRAVISPNGRHIAYAAANKLWIRDLASERARPVDGSDNAEGPFWSPDSTEIGFAAGRELKKASVQGGATLTLAKLEGPFRGGAWSPMGDRIIVSIAGVGLAEAPAAGGALKPVMAAAAPANTFYSPQYLPTAAGTARLLVASQGTRARQVLQLIDLEAGTSQTLRDGAYPVWSGAGHILFKSAPFTGGLWALPFSLSSRTPTGEAVPVLNSGSDFNVSEDGTLVWADLIFGGRARLSWIDRAGKRAALSVAAYARFSELSLSPDGARAAYTVSNEQGADVWILDVARSVTTRLTLAPEIDQSARWSPSGKEIAFASLRGGRSNIYVQAADGSTEDKLAFQGAGPDTPEAWSPDGQVLLFSRRAPKTGSDLWTVRRKEDLSFDEPSVWLQSAFDEANASFSPDGRFVAYTSNESGRPEIFVRSFPAGVDRRLISSNGGDNARWSRDGKEILHTSGDVLISVRTGPGAAPLGSSQELFKLPEPVAFLPPRPYDVSPNGRRFLFVTADDDAPAKPSAIHIIQNWPELLRQKPSGAK